MSNEQIILTSVQASVPVSWEEPRKAARPPQSEGRRISDLLRRATDFDSNESFRIGNREYRIEPSAKVGSSRGSRWVELPEGGCRGTLVLALVDGKDSVDLGFKLTGDTKARAGNLVLICDPAAVLVGFDACPTFAHPESKELSSFPSSSWWVNDKIFSLGFKFLATLHKWLGEEKSPLFDTETQELIDNGRIRISQLRWDATLQTSDPASFLGLLPAMYGHTISDGERYAQLASQLGLKLNFRADAKSSGLGEVTLEKRPGKKLLYTIRFTRVRRGVSVRFAARSDGLADLVSRGSRQLVSLRKTNPACLPELRADLLQPEAAPMAWSIADALFVLSHSRDNEVLAQQSLAWFLVDEMLCNVLRLNLLTGFKHEDLQALIDTDDDIVRAWRNTAMPSDKWADAIAKAVGKDPRTVRNHRNEWLTKYNIDIAIPYRFYHDLMIFGSTSRMPPEDRAALMVAMSGKDETTALQVLEGAWQDFEEDRLAMAKTVDAPLLGIDVEPVAGPIFDVDSPMPTKQQLATTKRRATPRAPTKAEPRRPNLVQPNNRSASRLPSGVAAKAAPKQLPRPV